MRRSSEGEKNTLNTLPKRSALRAILLPFTRTSRPFSYMLAEMFTSPYLPHAVAEISALLSPCIISCLSLRARGDTPVQR